MEEFKYKIFSEKCTDCKANVGAKYDAKCKYFIEYNKDYIIFASFKKCILIYLKRNDISYKENVMFNYIFYFDSDVSCFFDENSNNYEFDIIEFIKINFWYLP